MNNIEADLARFQREAEQFARRWLGSSADDGVSEWHCHPSNDPEKHMPCAKPRLTQVLREMKQIVESEFGGE